MPQGRKQSPSELEGPPRLLDLSAAERAGASIGTDEFTGTNYTILTAQAARRRGGQYYATWHDFRRQASGWVVHGGQSPPKIRSTSQWPLWKGESKYGRRYANPCSYRAFFILPVGGLP
jgi:hypothetical protein